ncbi:MAG: [FeFe] hydrogenase H-cluster radical SAM maturase HydE [Phycisphaerae bacterium]|nr:[FeFe] hydrogenase H-cluster radical SAM maturase HydE [Phycisphaerae bacterium]
MLPRTDILARLRETDPAKLEELRRQADAVRRENVGDDVHLRGLIEISNHCRRRCLYCGLRADNARVRRYRMTGDEILASARRAAEFGYGTVVLQGGEDPNITGEWLAEVIRRIKADPATCDLAITLSLGERSEEELALWRSAGADRYLLRFETSNRRLYEKIHPPRSPDAKDRFALLPMLKRLGYEVGTGIMVGIPGQSYNDLVADIELFKKLQPDMIGLGPFLPHPETPLGRESRPAGGDQPSNDEMTTWKMLALTRLACPAANIPGTTALATLNPADAYETSLQWGANVVMPNLTPPEYRRLYEIYPNKADARESAEEFHETWVRRITALGRGVGVGRGDSPSYLQRAAMLMETTMLLSKKTPRISRI